MKKIISVFSSWAALLPMLATAGCSDDGMPTPGPTATPLAVRLNAVSPEGSAATDAESAIHAVTGYRFEDGLLHGDSGIPSSDGGLYLLVGIAAGQLHLAVNAAGIGLSGRWSRETTILENVPGARSVARRDERSTV